MKEKYFDMIGVYAAFLCLIHCVLAPVLFLLPLGFSHNPIIDISFLTIGIFPVIKVMRSAAPLYIKVLLAISWVAVLVSVLLESVFHQESVLIFFGAGGLITGHLINYSNHKH